MSELTLEISSKRGGWKRKERQREDLTQLEAAELLKAAKKISRHPERDFCFLLLSLRHGLRVTEALNLRTSDVDLDGMQLNFRRLKQHNGGMRSARHPIYDVEAKALRAWLAKREKMNLGHTTLGGDHLFISEQRRQMSRSMVHRIIVKCAESAGLGNLNVHAHMLRHACGFDLANRGADTLLIKNFLGHANIQNTMIYTERAGRRFEILYNDKRTLR